MNQEKRQQPSPRERLLRDVSNAVRRAFRQSLDQKSDEEVAVVLVRLANGTVQFDGIIDRILQPKNKEEE